MLHELVVALEETLFMVLASGILTLLLGLPLGIFLSVAALKQKTSQKLLYRALKGLVSIASSIPYLVIVIALIPLLRLVFGTESGMLAAILPLTLATLFPFALYVERAMTSLPTGLNDLALSFGGNRLPTLLKIYLKEALPLLIQGFTKALLPLIGYSVIAGVFGAGGLGGLLIEKGYHHFSTAYVLATMAILVALTQGFRLCLEYFAGNPQTIRD
jgi:D-methionine transport system permease protein